MVNQKNSYTDIQAKFVAWLRTQAYKPHPLIFLHIAVQIVLPFWIFNTIPGRQICTMQVSPTWSSPVQGDEHSHAWQHKLMQKI